MHTLRTLNRTECRQKVASVVVSQELTIGMVFSNTGNVSLTVNMGALVTREQLAEAVKQHNTDISSHPAITAMIAKILGATNWQENPVATLKDIKNLLGPRRHRGI